MFDATLFGSRAVIRDADDAAGFIGGHKRVYRSY